jgi:hypothetical protein
MSLYPQRATSQGTCPNSLFFVVFTSYSHLSLPRSLGAHHVFFLKTKLNFLAIFFFFLHTYILFLVFSQSPLITLIMLVFSFKNQVEPNVSFYFESKLFLSLTFPYFNVQPLWSFLYFIVPFFCYGPCFDVPSCHFKYLSSLPPYFTTSHLAVFCVHIGIPRFG